MKYAVEQKFYEDNTVFSQVIEVNDDQEEKAYITTKYLYFLTIFDNKQEAIDLHNRFKENNEKIS